MRTIDRVLEVIRAHPEGITTLQIGRIIYPDYRNSAITANIYTKGVKLSKYGLVSRMREMRPNSIGQIVITTVWRPVE